MIARHPRSQLIETLGRQIRQIERTQTGVPSLLENSCISSGIPALDELLPGKGFLPGTLVEWLADGEGTGVLTLALLGVRKTLTPEGLCTVIDPLRQFYPPAVVPLEMSPSQIMLVRPGNRQDTLWALEQSLRCSGVAATLAWIDHLDARAFRRLQLAAETGNGLGILLRPYAAARQRSWADVRLAVRPLVPRSAACSWRLEIELLYCRGRMGGRKIEVENSDETDTFGVVAELAHSTCDVSTARA